MPDNVLRSLYLPAKLIELLNNATTDRDTLMALNLYKAPVLIDKRGLTPDDYATLQVMTKCSALTGDDLISHALLPPSPCSAEARRFMAKAIRANKRNHARTVNDTQRISFCRLAAALLYKGLESVENAATKSAAGKGRRTSKAA